MPPTTFNFVLFDRGAEDRGGRLQLGHGVDHVLPDRVLERILALWQHRLDRRRNGCSQRRDMSGQRLVILK
jgi:hypothetical protein